MRILVLLLAFSSLSWCQTGTGNIQGSVADSTGGIIPKAKVTATHTSTARKYVSETNEVGFYLFPAMPSGAYELSAESAGMNTWKGGLTLAAGDAAAVPIVMTPGATSTTVRR